MTDIFIIYKFISLLLRSSRIYFHLVFNMFFYCPELGNVFQKQPPEVFCKKGVLRNFTKFTGKHLCQSLFFNKVTDLRPACNFIKKETPAQVFSSEFCEISKNSFFTEHIWWLLLVFFILHLLNVV